MRTILLLSLALLATPAIAQTPTYIDHIPQPEDVVPLAGTNWLLAGSMRTREMPGHVYLIDAGTGAAQPLFPGTAPADPDTAKYAGCPGPVDETKFTPHGINVRKLADGSFELLTVNHGGRESIEIFHVSLDGTPRAAWRGCVVLPADASGNGVAPTDDGGFIVTNFLNKADPDYLKKMGAGEVTGDVLRWSPEAGWREALPQQFSGANGVEVSPDGKWLFVTEWSAYKVWKFPLHGHAAPRSIKLDFLPDNLRLTGHGTLLVAGQNADPVDVMSCKGRHTPCPPGFTVAEMDMRSMRVQVLAKGGDGEFGGSTGAAFAGNALWIGSYYGERIARYPH